MKKNFFSFSIQNIKKLKRYSNFKIALAIFIFKIFFFYTVVNRQYQLFIFYFNYKMAKLFCFVIFLCVTLTTLCKAQILKETFASTPKLISSAGYPSEKHRAYTEDGYILQMHRIPAGRRSARRSGSTNAKGKKAVLLVHGLIGSSGDFVIMGPERSLGYMLADAGYDVWLANLRGNIYTSHKNLTKNDEKFWDFSFHEHGKYDIPAMIDKILKVTKLSKILYIGYSMGSTSFFTLMSERPEYNNKLISAIVMAPAVYLDNIKPFAELILQTMNIPETLRSNGVIAINFRMEFLDMFVGRMCSGRELQADLCLRIIYSVVGEDYEQNDWNMLTTILVRFQPASWKQLEHFGKVAITGVFTSWEDGLYGKVKPYNLNNVKIPVTVMYGENDRLIEKSGVMKVAKTLNITGMLESAIPGCSWPKFNHLDFVYAKDVGKLLNKPLIKHIDMLFNKYSTR